VDDAISFVDEFNAISQRLAALESELPKTADDPPVPIVPGTKVWCHYWREWHCRVVRGVFKDAVMLAPNDSYFVADNIYRHHPETGETPEQQEENRT
jgi:hypothetical protein